MLLSQKYMPKKIDDIAGNDEARAKIKQWILNWLRGIRQRPLLIHGPTGTGKTAVAYALRDEFDLELIEMNTGDLRNADAVERVLASAGSVLSLSGKKKLLLIDDVDALQAKDRGGASAIVSVIKSTGVPLILTAENIWEKKLMGIRNEAQQLEFRRISRSSVSKVLRKIAEKEGMKTRDEELAAIADGCKGDLRSAINDLHTGVSEMRDREKDIFERVRTVFKSTTYRESRKACFGDVEHDYLKLWIDENIPLEYESREEKASAYNFLSRADVFDGRIISRQYWGFLRYSSDLMSAGVSLAKKERTFRFVRYSFPNYLRQMGTSAAHRAMQKEVGRKIGARTHSGWKEALDHIHILKHILDKNPESPDFYRLEDEEVAFILGISAAKIKEKFKTGKTKKKKEKPQTNSSKKGTFGEFS